MESATQIPINLRLGLPSSLFPSGFLTKILHAHRLSPKRATCPTHLIPLNLISLLIKYSSTEIFPFDVQLKDHHREHTDLCKQVQHTTQLTD